jgi:indolepyruvate ferredoxin oxidoreductase beta subunit
MSATDDAGVRPVTLLLAALGGQGGGVLTSWIVNAAQASGLPVQATSIPGVAQRTGATTYYVEIWPQPWSALNGRAPLLALAPAPGEVDVLAVTELLEAGRAVRAGFVTPERTLLIGSTHRFYTTAEKMQMGDGRYDPDTLRRAAEAMAKRAVLLDLERVARDAGAPLNAVLLGAIAGCGAVPIAEAAFREGIRAEGKAAEANLRGFEAGLAAVRAAAPGAAEGAAAPRRVSRAEARAASQAEALLAGARGQFPPAVQPLLEPAVARLVDFQDARYAALYLERLAPWRNADPALLASVARHLALRMTYEDAIRVAQAKCRPERLARVRAETGAAPGEPVVITEFLKPGLEEIGDILPVPLARVLLAAGRRWPGLHRIRPGMHLRSTTLWGYGRLRLLAALRVWRRGTWRFRQEQEAIGAWLALVRRAGERDPRLALEVSECARLIKGYGDTHRRGTTSFRRIAEALIRPALEGALEPARAAEAIAAARTAALADPEGDALAAALAAAAGPQGAGGLPARVAPARAAG